MPLERCGLSLTTNAVGHLCCTRFATVCDLVIAHIALGNERVLYCCLSKVKQQRDANATAPRIEICEVNEDTFLDGRGENVHPLPKIER